MRLFYTDPSQIAPPTVDITHVQLFVGDTETGSFTLLVEIPYVELQGYIDYGSPVEGKWYAIKFKDSADNVSPYLSRPVKFTTAVEPTCLVFDTLVGMDNVPIANSKIRVVLNTPNAKYQGKSVMNNDTSFYTDSRGNWDMPLIPNSLISPAGSKYIFYINGKTFERVVPNEQTRRFSDLKER